MKRAEKRKPLAITLVGMSGSGKSRWSKKLAEKGFRRVCCDDLIERDLSSELKKHGVKGIQGVAIWMGHPYEECFENNQAMYLNSEIRNMRKIIDGLKKGIEENIIIDTTGSVIYTGDLIMKELKKYSLVIYLETPMSSLPEMLKVFIEKPKPVIWKNMFRRNKNETDEEALRRCYPKLLRHRIKLYKKYADAVLRRTARHNMHFSADSLLYFAENAVKIKKSRARV